MYPLRKELPVAVLQAPALIVAWGNIGDMPLLPLCEQIRELGCEPHIVRIPLGEAEFVADQYRSMAKPFDLELADAGTEAVGHNVAVLREALHFMCFDDSCAVCYAEYLAEQWTADEPKAKVYLVLGFSMWGAAHASDVFGTYLRHVMTHLFCGLLGTDMADLRYYSGKTEGIYLPSQVKGVPAEYDICRAFA
jgi:hypothetical protein